MSGLQAFEVFGTVDLRGGQKMMGEVIKIAQASKTGLVPGLKAGAVAAGLLTAAVATFAMKSAMDFGKAKRIIIQDTGASGKALDGLRKDFKAVFTSAPEDVNTTAKTLAALNTRTGQVGKGLQTMTKQILDLGRVTGKQADTLVPLITRVYGDWSIATEDQAEATDYLYKVTQQTGIGIESLSETVVRFGAPLRQLGFTFEESAAMLGKWEREGVNTQTALAGLRFSLKTFAREGMSARDGLAQVTEQIKAAKTPAEATAIAMRVFGLRAGPDMAAAILEGRFAIDDLMRDLEASETTISDTAFETMTFGEKMAVMGHELEAAAEPLGEVILQMRTDLIPVLKEGVGYIADMGEAFGDLPQPTREASVKFGLLSVAAGLAYKPLKSLWGVGKDIVTWLPKAGAAAAGGFETAALKGMYLKDALVGTAAGVGATAVGAFAGAAAFGLWGQSVENATMSAEDIAEANKTAAERARELGVETGTVTTLHQNYAGVAEQAEFKTRHLADATHGAAAASDRVAASMREEARAVTLTGEALEKVTGSTRDASRAQLNLEEAQQRVKDAEAEYQDVVKEHGPKSDEAREADRRRREAALNLLDAQDAQALAEEHLQELFGNQPLPDRKKGEKWEEWYRRVEAAAAEAAGQVERMNRALRDQAIAERWTPDRLEHELNVPQRARGAYITSGPELAVIGEGRTAESLISHDPAYRKENLAVWEETGRALGVQQAAPTVILYADLGDGMRRIEAKMRTDQRGQGREAVYDARMGRN